MTKSKTKQLNVRVAPATIDKLAALKQQYGTQSQAVAVAIDRLYQAEFEQVDLVKGYLRATLGEKVVKDNG